MNHSLGQRTTDNINDRYAAESDYWSLGDACVDSLPETPLWVDWRKGEYLPYPRHYFPAMAASFDPFTYRYLFGVAYKTIYSTLQQHGNSVLEIGCGSGFLSLEMARLGKTVTAFDISETRINNAQKYYQKLSQHETIPGSISYFVANADSLQDFRKRFDIVICHGSLHHLVNVGKTIDAIYDLLAPEGVFIAFEHDDLDVRLKPFFEKLDISVGRLWSNRGICRTWNFLVQRSKKRLSSIVPAVGGSPMEGVASDGMKRTLTGSKFHTVISREFCPFSFHFIERFAIIFDWRAPFKLPALLLLGGIDFLLSNVVGVKGEILLWVGVKK